MNRSPGGATDTFAVGSVAPPGLRFFVRVGPGVALGLRPALHPGLTSVAPPGLKTKPSQFRPTLSHSPPTLTLLLRRADHLRAGGLRRFADQRVGVLARGLDVAEEVRAEVAELAQVVDARGADLAA